MFGVLVDDGVATGVIVTLGVGVALALPGSVAVRSTWPVSAGCMLLATEPAFPNAGAPSPTIATAAEAATRIPAAENFFMLSLSERIVVKDRVTVRDPSGNRNGPGKPRVLRTTPNGPRQLP